MLYPDNLLEKLTSYFSTKGVLSNDIPQIIDAFTFKKMAKGNSLQKKEKPVNTWHLLPKVSFNIFI
jgi:hypothetical protein